MKAIFETITANKRKRKTRTVIPSLGLVIPFQPSMQKESEILSLMNFATESVKTELADRYGYDFTNNVLDRLEKIFCKLNFNSHRKSLAIILTPTEEKVIYLGFRVKPAVFFSKSISLIDLVANSYREPDFFFLILQENNVKLFDTNNNKLKKIYEQNHDTNTVDLYKHASGVIELLNGRNEKPVFVSGNPQLVNTFYANDSLAEIMFKKLYQAAFFTDETIQLRATEIKHQWSHWKSKFIAGQILLAHKAGSLINNIEAVLQALCKKADGLLLMDKRLKKQLDKCRDNNSIVNISEELIAQIENFLARGNRIEITETGLLKDMGGIVLLHAKKYGVTEELKFGRHYEVGRAESLY